MIGSNGTIWGTSGAGARVLTPAWSAATVWSPKYGHLIFPSLGAPRPPVSTSAWRGLFHAALTPRQARATVWLPSPVCLHGGPCRTLPVFSSQVRPFPCRTAGCAKLGMAGSVCGAVATRGTPLAVLDGPAAADRHTFQRVILNRRELLLLAKPGRTRHAADSSAFGTKAVVKCQLFDR